MSESSTVSHPQRQIFHLNGVDTEATGYPTETGFLVLAGSLARGEASPSVARFPIARRDELIRNNVLVREGDHFRLAEDYQFSSPSGAASVMLGRHANGWLVWKLADSTTLGEVKRLRPPGALLTYSKREAIIAKQQELLSSGRIEPVAVLEDGYALFRQRFGPQVLQGLDGEALLNLMHDQSDKDSLVYWIEFKNDDELNTRRFGSIAGGSALKFRVFRRKETGRWNASDRTNRPVEVPLEQAIAIARQHKEQMLRGIELLEGLAEDAGPEAYAELQDQMDDLAPEFSTLAWGHKYFSILFPTKLDDYHSPSLQRFHLRKLLVEPPEGNGRYLCAWHFITAAREVGLHPNHLAAALNALHGSKHRYWRVDTTGSAGGQNHWDAMRNGGFIAVGWNQLGDLSWVAANKDSRERLRQELAVKYPNTAPAIGNQCSELTNFVAGAAEGDIVCAADGATFLGVGRIAGEYRHDPGFDLPHQRPIEWLSDEKWKMPVAEGLPSTFRQITKHQINIIETERRIQGATPPTVTPRTGSPGKPVRLPGVAGRIQSVLERKGQVILYGPPGTGKTYWAERTARDLAALAAFGEPFDNLDDDRKADVIGRQADGLYRMCCFHPAYGYEDFLEGYRPVSTNGAVAFELRDGIFKKLCADAAAAPERSFFLIIDEINRGDIPRIFGELLTTLEKDKRGKGIILPMSQSTFTIPRNVYLIGTMNTADRSISLLDAALRRRFGFVELMPDAAVLRGASVGGISLGAWIDEINRRIREHVGRDARNLQLGHSYLMHQGSPLKSVAALRRALRDDVIPLLEEYCYENYATLEKILGNELVDLENQRIRLEIFDEDREEELTKALAFAEISSAAEALSSDEANENNEESEIAEIDEIDEAEPEA